MSSLAMSVPTILMVSRCQVSRFQSPRLCSCSCRFWRYVIVIPYTFYLYTDNYSTYFTYLRFRLRNDLYCVGWGVKLYSLTYSLSVNRLTSSLWVVHDVQPTRRFTASTTRACHNTFQPLCCQPLHSTHSPILLEKTVSVSCICLYSVRRAFS